MVEIVVPADTVPPGAVVTGYCVARVRPAYVDPCAPARLTRVYRGFGKLRAETGEAPRRGYGQLIGCAEIQDRELSQGFRLWLRVRD